MGWDEGVSRERKGARWVIQDARSWGSAKPNVVEAQDS